MENKTIEPVSCFGMRLVKSEDLNHHGTLFAGRTAEWFVESGFIAAASLLDAKSVVCLKIHGMFFTKPARPGEILQFESRIVYTGRTSLTAYIKVTKNDDKNPIVDGFVTFIHVNEESMPSPHNMKVNPSTAEDIQLYEIAKNLKTK